jgi:hypothetical protein
MNEPRGPSFAVALLTGSTSALGQKQTYAVQKGMSALPPKADMCAAAWDVRYGPKADIGHRGSSGMLNEKQPARKQSA